MAICPGVWQNSGRLLRYCLSRSLAHAHLVKMRMFPSLESWGQSDLESLKTITLWGGALAAALAVLVAVWWNEFRERINARIETISHLSASGVDAPVFSARVKTVLTQSNIDAVPYFYSVVPRGEGRVAHGISAIMYLQFRNISQRACMVDSYSVEAKSDRGRWEVMQVWNVAGPDGLSNERLFGWNDPKRGTLLQPEESFTDAVQKKNLHPGETIQGLICLSMPQDWMSGDYRMRIKDSGGKECVVPINMDTTPATTGNQAQVAGFKVLAKEVNVSDAKVIRPKRSSESEPQINVAKPKTAD